MEAFLDDAARAGRARVRIIHGKGTGALRRAVRELLARHPLVTGLRERHVPGRRRGRHRRPPRPRPVAARRVRSAQRRVYDARTMTDELSAADSLPEADTPEVALPEQERFYRAPARFGHVPVAETPLGWDAKNRGFRNHYPHVRLPTQVVDRVSLGAPELEPNRLIWGDNLHAMRTLPSESVDLIYIDPPFFSNRVYNVIWGDEHEERSFSDIWEGGLDGYLIWLNARLYEMKRLLKPTGSIYVHCDWHASHYIKVEMDKIFGYENFQERDRVVLSALGGVRQRPEIPSASTTVILFYGVSLLKSGFNQCTGPPTSGSLTNV